MKRLLFALVLSLAVAAPSGAATVWQTQSPVTAAWTSSTASGASISVSVADYATAVVSVSSSGITDGSIAFEGSDDGANWYRVPLVNASSATPELFSGLKGSDSGLRLWQGTVPGLMRFRVRLVGTISGSGTATVRLSAQAGPTSPAVSDLASVDTNNGWDLLNMYLLKRNRLR